MGCGGSKELEAVDGGKPSPAVRAPLSHVGPKPTDNSVSLSERAPSFSSQAQVALPIHASSDASAVSSSLSGRLQTSGVPPSNATGNANSAEHTQLNHFPPANDSNSPVKASISPTLRGSASGPVAASPAQDPDTLQLGDGQAFQGFHNAGAGKVSAPIYTDQSGPPRSEPNPPYAAKPSIQMPKSDSQRSESTADVVPGLDSSRASTDGQHYSPSSTASPAFSPSSAGPSANVNLQLGQSASGPQPMARTISRGSQGKGPATPTGATAAAASAASHLSQPFSIQKTPLRNSSLSASPAPSPRQPGIGRSAGVPMSPHGLQRAPLFGGAAQPLPSPQALPTPPATDSATSSSGNLGPTHVSADLGRTNSGRDAIAHSGPGPSPLSGAGDGRGGGGAAGGGASARVAHSNPSLQGTSPAPAFGRAMSTSAVSNHGQNVRVFSYSELRSATGNFSRDNLLGEGGFGGVYKGQVEAWPVDGMPVTVGKKFQVAVKKLHKDSLQGHKEWLAEVNYLGHLHHPRLVRLLGYCAEEDHRLLVYEFVPNKSLEDHLFPPSNSKKSMEPLPWLARVSVATDAAKGLAFLHDEGENQVIFRDFKTANVLLDNDLRAKLSDFGLARAGPEGDRTHVSTQVVGTVGYAAPEYVLTGHLTARSDVWAFGVVLAELLTGRRALDETRPKEEQNMIEWARPFLNDPRRLFRIMDPVLEGKYSAKAAQKVASLTMWCLQRHPKQRPTMTQAVECLTPLLELTDTAGLASNLTLMSPRIQPPSPLGAPSPGQGGGRGRPTLQLEDPFARKFGGQLGMPPGGRGAPPKPPQLPIGKQLYASPLVAALREKERQLQQQQQGAGSNGSAVDDGSDDAQAGTVRDRANAGRAAPLAIQIGRPKPGGPPRVENTSVIAQSPIRGSLDMQRS